MKPNFGTSIETLMQHKTRNVQYLCFSMILAFFSEKCCQLVRHLTRHTSKISVSKLMKTLDENVIPRKRFAGYYDANDCESGGVCLVLRDEILDIWCQNYSRVFIRCSHAKKILFPCEKTVSFCRRHL
jgi:hypothetical protein